MVDYDDPRFSLGVSVLLDEIEADLSPKSSPENVRAGYNANSSFLDRHENSHSKQAAAALLLDAEPDQPHSRSADDDVDFDLKVARILNMQLKMAQTLCLPTRDDSRSEDESIDFDDELDYQAARALSLQPNEIAGAHDESSDIINQADYQAATRGLLSKRLPREFGYTVEELSQDVEDETDLRPARALSMQPWEVICAANETSVDFDDEIEFQDARALSLKPREVVCVHNESSVDFEDELEFQQARALSMQPVDVVLASLYR